MTHWPKLRGWFNHVQTSSSSAPEKAQAELNMTVVGPSMLFGGFRRPGEIRKITEVLDQREHSAGRQKLRQSLPSFSAGAVHPARSSRVDPIPYGYREV